MQDIATDFLYCKPLGKTDMPHENVFIGVAFEVDCHEDWGFFVVEFNYDKEINAFRKKIVGGGRTLRKAIEAAKEHYA